LKTKIKNLKIPKGKKSKNKEPEYQILRNKGIPLGDGDEIFLITRGNHVYAIKQKETPNHKVLTRVTNGSIPDLKGEKTLTIKHNQIIPEITTPMIGIPKIKRTTSQTYDQITIEINELSTGNYKVETDNVNSKSIYQSLKKRNVYGNRVEILTKYGVCYIIKKD